MCLIYKQQKQSAAGGDDFVGDTSEAFGSIDLLEFTVTTVPLAALNFIARPFP